jgi:hypothetical protein
MTRTYRMYVDTGISDALLNYIKNDLPESFEHGGRITATRFERGPDTSYFEFEYIVDWGPGSESTEEFGIEAYYDAQLTDLREKIIEYQARFELIFDSGSPP